MKTEAVVIIYLFILGVFGSSSVKCLQRVRYKSCVLQNVCDELKNSHLPLIILVRLNSLDLLHRRQINYDLYIFAILFEDLMCQDSLNDEKYLHGLEDFNILSYINVVKNPYYFNN